MHGKHRGFATRWLGPYHIRNLFDGRVYEVDRDRQRIQVHADQIRPVPQRPLTPPESPDTVANAAPSDDDVDDIPEETPPSPPPESHLVKYLKPKGHLV